MNRKKRYAEGGEINAPGQQFNVGGNFLSGLLQSSGLDATMLDRLRQKAGLEATGFQHPIAKGARQAPKARVAEKAAKKGGMIKKRKKYI